MEILYFEPTDEVTRAIERVRAAKSRQVALVLPQNSLILQSIVNLKLIKRISQQADKDIVLVTIDKIGRNLAGQVGLTVYGKIEDGVPIGKVITKTPEPVTSGAVREKILQETEEITTVTGIQVHHYDRQDPLVQLGATEEEGTPSEPQTMPDLAERGREPETAPTPVSEPTRSLKPAKPRRRGRRWLIGLLIILLGWWFFTTYLKTTRIILTVKGQAATVEENVTAVGNPGTDQIKLYVYTSEQSGTKQVAATGTKNLGNKAKGTVSLVNSYSSTSQSIPAGATLTINGQSFTLLQAVVIPGAEFAVEGTTVTVKKPGKVDGNIEAAAAGESYNINGGRMTIVGVTDQRDGKVYGDSPVTSGGTTVNKKVATAEDLDNLKSVLLADLTAQANEDINGQAPSDFLPVTELAKNDTLSYEASVAAGAEADQISATAKVGVRAAGVTKGDLIKYASDQVTKNQSDRSFGTDKDPAIGVVSADSAAMLANLKLTVEGTVSAKIDTEALKKQVLGKKETDARTILATIPMLAQVEFRYAPSFLSGRVSRHANRVSVEVKYE